MKMKRFCRQVITLVLLALPLVSKARRTRTEWHRLLPTYLHYSPTAPTKSPHIIGYTDEADCEGWGEGTQFFGQLQVPVSIFRSSAASGSSETSRYWYHNNCPHNRGTIQPILGATFPSTPPPSRQPSPSSSEQPTLTPSDFPSLSPTATTKPLISNQPTTTTMRSLVPSIPHEPSVSNQPVASAVPSSISSLATNVPTPSSSNGEMQQPPSATVAPSAATAFPTNTTTIEPTTVTSAGGTTVSSMEGTQTDAPTVFGMTTSPGAVEMPRTTAPSTGGTGTEASIVSEMTAASVSTETGAPTITGTIAAPSVGDSEIGEFPSEAPSSGLSFFGAETASNTIAFSDSSSEASVVVLAAPFSVTYEADGRVAGLGDLTTASDVTLHYLNRFFIQHFKFRSEATMRRFAGEVIGRATKPARIGYEVRVVLAPDSELPSSEDLDSLLIEAFEQPAVQELLDALGQGPPENPLSVTDSVTYDPMSPFFLLGGASQEFPEDKGVVVPTTEKKVSGLLVAFMVLLVFTICFVALVLVRRKGSKGLPEWIKKEKTDLQEQNNLMAFRDDDNESSAFGSQCYGEISKFTEV